jgi:hypothetical protein
MQYNTVYNGKTIKVHKYIEIAIVQVMYTSNKTNRKYMKCNKYLKSW